MRDVGSEAKDTSAAHRAAEGRIGLQTLVAVARRTSPAGDFGGGEDWRARARAGNGPRKNCGADSPVRSVLDFGTCGVNRVRHGGSERAGGWIGADILSQLIFLDRIA